MAWEKSIEMYTLFGVQKFVLTGGVGISPRQVHRLPRGGLQRRLVLGEFRSFQINADFRTAVVRLVQVRHAPYLHPALSEVLLQHFHPQTGIRPAGSTLDLYFTRRNTIRCSWSKDKQTYTDGSGPTGYDKMTP